MNERNRRDGLRANRPEQPRAVDAAPKGGGKPRPAPKAKERPASKGRVRKGRSRA